LRRCQFPRRVDACNDLRVETNSLPNCIMISFGWVEPWPGKGSYCRSD
jgi:hypothetical protein